MKKSKNQDQISIQNIIAKGTKIVGDFFSEGDLRVDGTVEGNIETAGKVVVGKEGVILGKLSCSNAYFEGQLKGTLELTGTLTLKSTAHIEGDVVIEKLAVEPGATFNVSCVMKSSVKDINGTSKQQKTA
ncbi:MULTISPECIES: bactofilin family protein [Mesoflavibacter]|uniref:Polymer-forming cytoskeletal protein n=1 Tax=Mesoflavibacter profundi TaxID=2708110 RepID=A0ABT4S1D2_9FLAO|nr:MULTISPECIES: polymer-forming cytoskeletal protein [Mesoflavibacter]MDA0177879.1 polymer-forming cytoskeletal protein [Mesoflavibacter profundi]QIJ88840.1 Polymer-forming bactofilin [Mesoflavibacter sp. HG96]QIJ91568.1 Polymer-forming bactofilin [Mesoflavibacter sp. HG37]